MRHSTALNTVPSDPQSPYTGECYRVESGWGYRIQNSELSTVYTRKGFDFRHQAEDDLNEWLSQLNS